MAEIISAAIGPIAIIDCAIDSGDCIQKEFCSCRSLWRLINQSIEEVLQSYTLADLITGDLDDKDEYKSDKSLPRPVDGICEAEKDFKKTVGLITPIK